MSWTIDLKANKDIKQEDVDSIAINMPQLSSFMGNSKQSWGWSCAVDVWNPEGRGLTLHGAGFSRNIRLWRRSWGNWDTRSKWEKGGTDMRVILMEHEVKQAVNEYLQRHIYQIGESHVKALIIKSVKLRRKTNGHSEEIGSIAVEVIPQRRPDK